MGIYHSDNILTPHELVKPNLVESLELNCGEEIRKAHVENNNKLAL
jgi:hypothetical protein